MKLALYIISLLWIVLGILLILYTERTRKVLKQLFFRERVRPLAIVPFIVGLILVVGAYYNREMFWLAFILGLLAIIKGVYLFFGPSHQIKGVLEWWFLRAGEGTIRLWGLVSFVLGTAVLSYLM